MSRAVRRPRRNRHADSHHRPRIAHRSDTGRSADRSDSGRRRDTNSSGRIRLMKFGLAPALGRHRLSLQHWFPADPCGILRRVLDRTRTLTRLCSAVSAVSGGIPEIFGAPLHRYLASARLSPHTGPQYFNSLGVPPRRNLAQRGTLWWAAKRRPHHNISDTDLNFLCTPPVRGTGFLLLGMGWIFVPHETCDRLCGSVRWARSRSWCGSMRNMPQQRRSRSCHG